jgi:hypothetical protein
VQPTPLKPVSRLTPIVVVPTPRLGTVRLGRSGRSPQEGRVVAAVAAEGTRRVNANLPIGMRVWIDNHLTPRYLPGRPGTSFQIDRTTTTATACLAAPPR